MINATLHPKSKGYPKSGSDSLHQVRYDDTYRWYTPYFLIILWHGIIVGIGYGLKARFKLPANKGRRCRKREMA